MKYKLRRRIGVVLIRINEWMYARGWLRLRRPFHHVGWNLYAPHTKWLAQYKKEKS